MNIINVFKDCCNYQTINKLSDIKLRNIVGGIQIQDALIYRFLYSEIGSTKEEISDNINILNNTNFSRQSFERKDSNIPLSFYNYILSKICIINNNINTDNNIYLADGPNLIGVDGVYNNDHDRNIMLNLGIFDITKNIPIDIGYYGINSRNKEVKLFMEYIQTNISSFRNAIFIFDRLYYNFKLIEFFLDNDIKFIIRVKGVASNLDKKNPLKNGTPNYDIINRIRSEMRVVKCKKSYLKTVIITNRKMKKDIRHISVKSDCIIATNLTDKRKYSNETLLDYYRQRWDIEVFFKFIKYNFKFQNLNEKTDIQYQKLYVCELIITHILKSIENYYWKDKVPSKFILKKNGQKVECVEKINKSHTIKGIFKHLLKEILYGTLTKEKLDIFCKKNILKIKNEKDRSFPRYSKTPFTKWYIKGYSDITKFSKIVYAIISGTVNELNKNLKTLAKKITLMPNG